MLVEKRIEKRDNLFQTELKLLNLGGRQSMQLRLVSNINNDGPLD